MATKRSLGATLYDEKRRRTNSLGTAKVDCHTCQRRQRRCDRQRPKCGNCISDGRDCGGFVMSLVWKDQLSKASLSVDEGCSAIISADHGQSSQFASSSSSSNTRKRAIKFVQGMPKVKRKPKEQRSKPPTFSIGLQTASDNYAVRNIYVGDQRDAAPYFLEDIGSPETLELLSISEKDDSPLDQSNSDSFYTEDDDAYLTGLEACSGATGTAISLDYNMRDFPSPSVDGQTNLYDTLSTAKYVGRNQLQTRHSAPYAEQAMILALQKQANPYNFISQSRPHDLSQILTLYDEEFCILPLSTDCDSNPFRVNLQQCENNPFLLHSILALSFQHLAKKLDSPALVEETSRHRSEALQLYSQALTYSHPSLLLDTLLILFNFEVTQSAFSGWTVHLRGAQKILDAMNVTDLLRSSSRLRAQVATLVWWDITIAFISRQETRLSLQYLDILIENNHKDEWTFFALNGCPAELITAMRRLAKLASIYEKAAKLEWTSFNTQPVDLILKDVLCFENREDVSFEDFGDVEDDSNAQRDRYHCIEAWRSAILLYARRVFHAEQDARGLSAIDHLTRVILDHIRCIKSTSRVQKQVLLPIFLAAAELGDDETDRDFVRSYCVHWSTTARYSQFESALSWLEKIWLDWRKTTRNTYWWGCKVGGETTSSRDESYTSMGSELLLG